MKLPLLLAICFPWLTACSGTGSVSRREPNAAMIGTREETKTLNDAVRADPRIRKILAGKPRRISDIPTVVWHTYHAGLFWASNAGAKTEVRLGSKRVDFKAGEAPRVTTVDASSFTARDIETIATVVQEKSTGLGLDGPVSIYQVIGPTLWHVWPLPRREVAVE